MLYDSQAITSSIAGAVYSDQNDRSDYMETKLNTLRMTCTDMNIKNLLTGFKRY